jgi:hypothetical protein
MFIDFKMATILTCFVLLGFLQQPYIYALYQKARTVLISKIGLLSIILFLVLFCCFILTVGKPDMMFFVYAGLITQVFRSLLFIVSGYSVIRNRWLL